MAKRRFPEPPPMHEKIVVVPDQAGKGEDFDKALEGTLPDFADLKLIVKKNGTKGGRPIIMLAFTVHLPDGSIERVQTVTTLRNFLNAADMLDLMHGVHCGRIK